MTRHAVLPSFRACLRALVCAVAAHSPVSATQAAAGDVAGGTTVATGITVTNGTTDSADTTDHEAALTRALAPHFASATFPGACVAVVRDGEVAYRHAFGFADVATRQPYTLQTVQPIGSVSKTVIGLAVVKAVELGLVDLDAPISRYSDLRVVNPRHPKHAITLRQLATHTSSIVDQEAAYLATYQFGTSRPDVSLHDYLRAYLQPDGHHFKRGNYAPEAPGTAFHYSNVGAALAAFVVESASGMAFDRFTQQHVLVPLRLHDTGWFPRADQAGRTATLYTPERSRQPPYVSVTYPDGSLRSTCADLANYLAALTRAASGAATPPLAPAGYESLFMPQFSAGAPPRFVTPKEPNQALFFAIRPDGNVGHTGSDYGASAFLFLDARTRTGRLFVTNVDVQEDAGLQKSFAAIWKTLGEAAR